MTETDAPPQVRRAISLLWVTIALSAVEGFWLLVHPDPEIADMVGQFAAFVVATLGFVSFLVVQASRRRNWARHTLLALFVFSSVMYILFPPESPEPFWVMMLTVVATVLEAIALYMLYAGAGGAWYVRSSS